MKKVLCLLLVLAMALGCAGISVSAADYGTVLNNNVALVVGSTNAVANNALVSLPAAPVREGNEVLIPVYSIPALFNGSVTAVNAEVLNISFGVDKVMMIRVGSTNYTLNGRAYTFDVAPQVVNGVIMIPVIALARDVIGQTVFADPGSTLVVVSDRRVIKDAATDAAVIATVVNAIVSGNLPAITVPTSYELDWSIKDEEATVGGIGGGAGGSAGPVTTKLALNASMVTASSEPEPENNSGNLVDENLGSVWAAQGECSAVIDLGQAYDIASVGVQMKNYDDGRSVYYGVDVSADGSNYSMIYDGSCASGGGVMETQEVNQNARYIRLRTNGNTTNDWASVAEVEVYVVGAVNNTPAAGGTGGSAAGGAEIPLTMAMIAAETFEADNPPANVLDGNTGSWWAASKGASMTIDLGSAVQVSGVGVQMRSYDDGRTVYYAVSTSADGGSYTSCFDGGSPAGGGSMEVAPVNASARYIKIETKGNSVSDWASVAEVRVYGGSGAGGAAVGGSYPNMSSVSGQFIIAPDGSTNVLTVDSDNATLTLRANTKDSKQIWSKNNNSYGDTFVNSGTGYCMDVFNQSYDEGGQVGVWEGNDGNNQAWSLELEGNGYYIKNVMSGLYLAASGSNIQQRSKGSATKWVIADPNAQATAGAGGAVVSGGGYPNMNNISGQFVLSVKGTTNVLTVDNDNSTLTIRNNTKDAKQTWTKSNNSYGDTIVNSATGYCVDVFNQSYDEGGQVGVWEGNDGNNQAWVFELDGDGYYVKNVMSGLYLAANGSNIQQVSKGSATKWVVSAPDAAVMKVEGVSSINGEFTICVYGTTNALTVDSDGFTLLVQEETGNAAQTWTKDVNPYGDALKSKSTGYLMDVSGQSHDEGAQICVWEGNGGDNQGWALEQEGEGYYIRSAMSGLYLTYAEGTVQQRSRSSATKWSIKGEDVEIVDNTDPNVPVAISSPVNGEFRITIYGTNNVLTVGGDGTTVEVKRNERLNSQSWTMASNSHGFTLVNEATGNVLDVNGASTDVGIKIGAWENNDGENQAWVLEKVGNYYYIKNVNSGLYICYDATGLRQREFAYATKWALRPNN